jgi:hypothetical protein
MAQLDEKYFVCGESHDLNGETFKAYGCPAFPLCLFVGPHHDPVATIHFQYTYNSPAALTRLPPLVPTPISTPISTPTSTSISTPTQPPTQPASDGKKVVVSTKVVGDGHPLAANAVAAKGAAKVDEKESGRWQAVFGEKGQDGSGDVEVVLTNLCRDETLLMDVIHEGLVTNKINAIRPGQIFVVKGNQHYGNRTMGLQTIKDANGIPSLTVKSDLIAVANGEKPKEEGVQLQIRIAPSTTNPSLVANFKHPETHWLCVDRFVIRQVLPPIKKQLDKLISGIHALPSDLNALDWSQERIESLITAVEPSADKVWFKKSKTHTTSFGQRASNFINSLLKRDEKQSPPPPPPPLSIVRRVDSMDLMNTALNSNASRLVVSDRVVDVAWQHVPDTYDRGCAQLATVGLSVNANIRWFKQSATMQKSMLTELAKMTAENRAKTFVLKNQDKHVPDECVVCLDAPPTTLLFPCAHRCVCNNPKCLEFTNCPLCRFPVRAFLPTDTPFASVSSK